MAEHRLGSLIEDARDGAAETAPANSHSANLHQVNPAQMTPAITELDTGTPVPIQRIVLTGFMGAGKTTVGNLLGKRLGWRFVDADVEIEAAAGTTIAQLFLDCGEPWFRQLEHETIRKLLEAESIVLALGGGAIEDERTRSLMLEASETRLIHLEASLPTVLKRCQGTEGLRPVLQDTANLEGRYLRRLPLYRQAHVTLDVDALDPEAAIHAILDHLGIPPAI